MNDRAELRVFGDRRRIERVLLNLPDVATSLRLEDGSLQVHLGVDAAVLDMVTACYDVGSAAMDISVVGASADARVVAIREALASSVNRGRGAASAAG